MAWNSEPTTAATPYVERLLREYGSHERGIVVYDWWAAGEFDEAEMSDVLTELLIDAWVGRNEKMGDSLWPEAWEELFDCCRWPVTDGAPTPQLPLTAYRAGHPEGMSWTLDLAVAEKFAERGRQILTCRVADTIDILGLFDGRGEREIVLRPRGAWTSTVTELAGS